jgi:hypothetical protein
MNDADRLQEAIRVLRKTAGSAAAARQSDPAKYLQDMARDALRMIEPASGMPSRAPAVRPMIGSD